MDNALINSRSSLSWRHRAASALAGLATGAMGLGVAQLVAGLSPELRSPIFDVGDRVVDNVPTFMKDLAIAWFGTNDKIALLAGIFALLGVYSAVVGVLTYSRGLRIGVVGLTLFGIVGSVAALSSRSGAVWYAPLPSVLGTATALLCLAFITRPSPQWSTATEVPDSDRRAFLAGSGALAVTAAAFAVSGRWLAARFSAAESRAAIRLPVADRALAVIPAGVQAPSADPFITANADFYRIDTALTVPQIPAETWTLTVTGMVERELRISYEDLLRRELVESDITLTCVSNTVGGRLVGNARWMGVRLDDLLAEAGIDPAATQIVGRSVDGYTCGFPVAALDGRDALVAIAMNGEPLPLEHGFPARLIVPGIYGYASATKWLTEIELTTFEDFDHYWVPRGYAVEAPIKLQSRIDSPRGLDRIASGPFVIGGVAWAQTIGIGKVEVRIDDSDWQPAILADELSNTTWRQWSFPWEATSGRHSIEVRATDNTGVVQSDERAEPLPDGASGRHTVVVLVD